jgi:hypothetical protein
VIDKSIKPIVAECFADNGEHSHFSLLNPKTGETVWEECDNDDLKEVAIRAHRNLCPSERPGKKCIQFHKYCDENCVYMKNFIDNLKGL